MKIERRQVAQFQESPGTDILIWLTPLGRAVKLYVISMRAESFRALRWQEVREHCFWMGEKSFHLIAFSACAISIALTIQCVLELKKYDAEDISGAVISIGLLRELGPLTVSLAWGARVACRVAGEAREFLLQNEGGFAETFILPRYLAALSMSLPLAAYGLVIGFVTAALIAPFLGVSSTADFLQSAKEGIHSKDLAIYFLKLVVVNPTIAIFAACASAKVGQISSAAVPANAVTAMFICGYTANLLVTAIAFLT
jgi:phospholipid/cholesterol/gamma-HCH transport system permease protein